MPLIQTTLLQVLHMSLSLNFLPVLQLVFRRSPDRVLVLPTVPHIALSRSLPPKALPIFLMSALISAKQKLRVHHKLPQLLPLQVPLQLQSPLQVLLPLQVQAQAARKVEVLTISLSVRTKLGDQFLIDRSILSLLSYWRDVGGWTTLLVGCLI